MSARHKSPPHADHQPRDRGMGVEERLWRGGREKIRKSGNDKRNTAKIAGRQTFIFLKS